MTSLGWRIFYSDGSTFDSEQGKSEDAPAFGVICIVHLDKRTGHSNVGRLILHMKDFYFMAKGEWRGVDLPGLLDALRNHLPFKNYCEGRTVSNIDFDRIMNKAKTDSDFPRKSANAKGERPLDG